MIIGVEVYLLQGVSVKSDALKLIIPSKGLASLQKKVAMNDKLLVKFSFNEIFEIRRYFFHQKISLGPIFSIFVIFVYSKK